MKKFTEIHGNSMMRFWRYRRHEEYSGYRIHGNSIVGVFTKKDRKEGILMFNFLNSESLWIGTDMKKFNEIRTQLEQEGIPYKYKTKDHLSQTMYPAEGTLRSRTGSFGNKPDQMIEYEILVKKTTKRWEENSDLRSKGDASQESQYPIFVTLVAADWMFA